MKENLYIVTAAGVEHRFTGEEITAKGGLTAVLETLPGPRSVRLEVVPEDPAEALARAAREQWAISNYKQKNDQWFEKQKAAVESWGRGLRAAEASVKRTSRRWFVIGIIAGAISLAFLVYAGINIALSATTDNRCAAHGYPDGKVTITFRRYCMKRVNQTDVVVPLEDLR